MSLKIVRESDPIVVSRINLCIYGPPGVGKSSLAFTADAPLMLDTDEGAYRAINRKDSVSARSWEDIANIEKADLEPYNTIIVDTAGRTLDKLTAAIIQGNPKMGRGGALTLQGFGELKSRFTAWMKMLNSFGKDVALLCHMEEKQQGDVMIERLDVQGGSKGEIYKSVDAMGKLYIENKKKYLDFSPRENSYGKNPGQLELLEVPDLLTNSTFLADVIARIKGNLNKMSEAQKEAQEFLGEWQEAINDLSTVDEFNQLLPEAMKSETTVKMLLHKAAKEHGFTFNQKTRVYEAVHVTA